MSDSHAAAPTADHAAHPSRVKMYVTIFVVLTVLTAIEVVLGNSPHVVSHAAFVALLTGFTILKAGLVAMYFMHLKYERRTLRIVVAAPLVFFSICVTGLMFEFQKWMMLPT